MLSYIIMRVITLSVIMLCAIMLSVIMLSVVVPQLACSVTYIKQAIDSIVPSSLLSLCIYYNCKTFYMTCLWANIIKLFAVVSYDFS
jgi:hypothetical protein